MRLDAVLITGAGSGIGRAVALACAAPGRVLHLADRDAAALTAASAACRALGAVVREGLLDVADAAAMEAWVLGAGALDFVLANAGVSFNFGEAAVEREVGFGQAPMEREFGQASPGLEFGQATLGRDGGVGQALPGRDGGFGGASAARDAQVRDIMAINLGGMLNTVLPAMRAMLQRAPGPDGVRGRVAAVASLAAFMPVPGAAAYSASKAAVDSWMVASAASARRQGIVLSSVCPGYVLTPMTAVNDHAMPGLMQPEEAARIILRGVAAGRRRVAFPWWLQACARIGGLLPPALVEQVVGLRARAARAGAAGAGLGVEGSRAGLVGEARSAGA